SGTTITDIYTLSLHDALPILCEEIIKNAVSAGIYDSRFLPVEIEELEDIDFSVDVLTEPQRASVEELDPKKYGIIVKSGPKLGRSEEHTSELQSRENLVCRLL